MLHLLLPCIVVIVFFFIVFIVCCIHFFELVLVAIVVFVVFVCVILNLIWYTFEPALAKADVSIESTGAAGSIFNLIPRILIPFILMGLALLAFRHLGHQLDLGLHLLQLSLKDILALCGHQILLLVVIEHRRRATELILNVLFINELLGADVLLLVHVRSVLISQL